MAEIALASPVRGACPAFGWIPFNRTKAGGSDQAQEVFHLGQGFDFEEVAAARDEEQDRRHVTRSGAVGFFSANDLPEHEPLAGDEGGSFGPYAKSVCTVLSLVT